VLDKLLIVELASVLAGPSVGQFFAELGARVVKIENPATGGDVTRAWYRSGEDRSRPASYFDACNFGKESVALDIRTSAGQGVLRQLVEKADILLTSFGPGSAERLGLTPPVFAAWNPRLIQGAVSGYGPSAARPGYDAVIQAESGFMDLNGDPDGPPVKMPVAFIDLMAAHHLKEAILVQLLKRRDSGTGAYLEVSLLDAALASLANQATSWMRTGITPRRSGSVHPNIAPYGTVLRTADQGSVLLAVGNDRQFQALCRVLGCTHLASDAELADNAGRVAERSRLDAGLQLAAGAWSSKDLMAALNLERVPAGLIRTVAEALSDESAGPVLLRSSVSPEAAAPLGTRVGLGSEPQPRGLRQWLFHPKRADLSAPPRLGAQTRLVLAGLTDLAPNDINLLIPAIPE
jgi:crotonobetainyl-CoA:carnitine CoA-transferase CaiB-like acyl-CoA transferase